MTKKIPRSRYRTRQKALDSEEPVMAAPAKAILRYERRIRRKSPNIHIELVWKEVKSGVKELVGVIVTKEPKRKLSRKKH